MNVFYINLKNSKYYFYTLIILTRDRLHGNVARAIYSFCSFSILKVKTKNGSLVSSDRRENIIKILGNTSVEICRMCGHRGSFSILCKTCRLYTKWMWEGSIKWRKGVALCHNGTMHVTGNITPEMLQVFARRGIGARRGKSNWLREGKRDRGLIETSNDFFCIVAIYWQE